MTVVAGRRLLSEGLQVAMAAATARPCGLMQWDQNYLDELTELPGILIEPLVNPNFIRGWGPDWREAQFPYAIHSFGVDMRSTEAMADLAQEAFVGGAWSITGYDIIDARPDSDRSTPEQVATELFSVRENFILHVMAV